MKRTDKDKLVQFWIDKEKHRLFKEKCKIKAINPSEWHRQKIEEFITEENHAED